MATNNGAPLAGEDTLINASNPMAQPMPVPASVSLAGFTKRQLSQLCDRRHPEYMEKMTHWNFLRSTYESGREWFINNIFKFVREGETTYKGRVQRAYRFNHTREIVDLVNKYLFKSKAARSEEIPEFLTRFRARVTLQGASIEEFERDAARQASIYGCVYAVVDSNVKNQSAIPITVADEKRGNVKVYSYLVDPRNVLDMGYDEAGQLEWIIIREIVRDDTDPFTSSGFWVERFRLWTRTEWILFHRIGKNVVLRERGRHDLGVVPVVRCDHIQSDRRYSVPGLIEDIAYLDRASANYLSNLDQIINDQTFSQLTMPAQGLLPSGTNPASMKDDDEFNLVMRRVVQMGTSQVLLYDGENGEGPKYIAPDPRQAQLIITAIKQIINEIYHTVGLAGERTKNDNAMGIDNSSGVAKAFDFERVNALLAAKASSMQKFTKDLEILVRLYNGQNPDDIEVAQDPVVYSMNFDVRNLAEEVQVSSQLALLNFPMMIRQEQAKVLLDKLWPLMGEEKRKLFEEAIANWEDDLYIQRRSTFSSKSAMTDAIHGTGQPPKGQIQNQGSQESGSSQTP